MPAMLLALETGTARMGKGKGRETSEPGKKKKGKTETPHVPRAGHHVLPSGFFFPRPECKEMRARGWKRKKRIGEEEPCQYAVISSLFLAHLLYGPVLHSGLRPSYAGIQTRMSCEGRAKDVAMGLREKILS